ncbi:unnamed protein product, partial [Cuscuta campestris]
KELATDLILQSLPELYKGFVMNYMMHDLDKPLPELLKMLQTAEENLTKGKGASVLMVQGGKGKPKKGIKIKARMVGKPKSKSTSSATQKPIGGVAKGKCHHYVGNGAPVAALAIGTYSLVLPSGLMLELNDCLYVPAISRNIISVSCLDKSGFIISIKNKSLSVYRKNVFYANANMTNGLYVLDLDMPVYNISAKRNKLNGLNQTYLWHCRLGHINEKRISKLHRSVMLESFDLESYDTCESCLLEAEYMAAAEAAKEGVWLKNFITELGVVPSIKNPIPLFCDNNGAIAQAKEPRSHQKTKHIVRRYHIIREIVARGDVEICKIGTDDNIADPLTKALGKPKHESHTWSMGIREMLDWP